MTQNRYYSSTAKQATITDNPLLVGATSLNVSAKTGFPSSTPYTLIIARDTPSEEVVTVTAESGLTLTVTRGQDGTTAVQHAQGSTVEHGVSARDFDEPQAHIANGQIHNSRAMYWAPFSVDPWTCDTTYLMSGNEIHYYKFRATESMTINYANFYVTTAGAAGSSFEVAVYDSTLTTVLGQGSTTAVSSSISATGYWTVTLNNAVSLVQGHDYWIAIHCTAGSGAGTLLARGSLTAGAVAGTGSLGTNAGTRAKQGSAASLANSPVTSTWTGTKIVSVNLSPSSQTIP